MHFRQIARMLMVILTKFFVKLKNILTKMVNWNILTVSVACVASLLFFCDGTETNFDI